MLCSLKEYKKEFEYWKKKSAEHLHYIWLSYIVYFHIT